jgi:hypothetical protein
LLFLLFSVQTDEVDNPNLPGLACLDNTIFEEAQGFELLDCSISLVPIEPESFTNHVNRRYRIIPPKRDGHPVHLGCVRVATIALLKEVLVDSEHVRLASQGVSNVQGHGEEGKELPVIQGYRVHQGLLSDRFVFQGLDFVRVNEPVDFFRRNHVSTAPAPTELDNAD